MKPLQERNLAIVGAIGIGVTIGVALAALQYDKLPAFTGAERYSAYFTDASGLQPGADVQVAGHKVGKVSGIDLDEDRVLVNFEIGEGLDVGDRSEAAIKTNSLLGLKVLEVIPRGAGRLDQPIPTDRTNPAYQLPDALGDLSSTISDLNTTSLNESLATLAAEFADTPEDLKSAVAGVMRFSATLNSRDQQLRDLLGNARMASSVLAERTDQVVVLIENSAELLAQLRAERKALDDISGNISSLAEQLSALIAEHRTSLRPALEKLSGVMALIDNRRDKVQESLALLHPFMLSLGESVSSGPFFKPYITNLLPGQFLQPFIEAAFSDLGLDPNVLLPSELTDPQIGQPATPALPVPYPRTGQAGDPHLTLPDAITGNPGDQRYPYRAPTPAPPPGGPPPGPPGDAISSGTTPTSASPESAGPVETGGPA